ncbi:MAG: hypothetical protein NW223_07450 [Hyphomicrobiaceae bacterium]|nr:hypothetical protein [Hyphomicrobiaceae bacterium]
MQRFRSIAAATMLALGALGHGPAMAQELVVMPYRCTVYDGRPVLTPSEDQGYRVLGPREQRALTTCSQADPGLCRQWALHRFDMDCGGVPVSWANVVASAYADRVREDGGQLQIRMPPRWAMAPDDPCARGNAYEGGGWRRGRFDRYCDDRRAMSPPSYVNLPAGFAPMFGINAVFVAARTAPGQPLPPPPLSTYEGPRSPGQAPGYAQPAPPKGVAALPPAPRPEPAQRPEPPRRPEPAQKPEPRTELPKAETPPTAPVVIPLNRPPAPQAGLSEPARPPGTAVVPKIINRETAPAPAPPSPPASEPAPPAAKPVQGERSTTVEKPVAVETTVVPAPKPAAETIGLAAFLTGPDAPLALAFAAFASIALVGGIVAWRLRTRGAVQPERDFSSISFGPGARADVVVSQRSAPPAPPRGPSSPADIGIGERMPATRAEALRVLGMGVAPDATIAALKKIIDGLRQTWHPDLAQDEEDRALRELRMKQLNAAWEILSPRPTQDSTA